MSNKDEIVGNSRRNLVIKTAGIIRVLVGDKYYNLNFRDQSNDSKNEDVENNVTQDFIIAESIKPYNIGKIDYPGDNKVIFTLDGDIYYTKQNKYNKYLNIKTEHVDNSPFSVSSNGSVIISNSNMVGNLNAQYLNGKTSSDFIENAETIRLKKIVVDSIESYDGNFYYKDGITSIEHTQNKFKYISLNNDYTLKDDCINYTIKSNEYKVILPNDGKSSIFNIFAIDDITIDMGSNSEVIDSNSFNTFRYVPINELEYKWIRKTDNYFIEY